MDDFFKEVKAAFPIYPIPSFDWYMVIKYLAKNHMKNLFCWKVRNGR